MAENMMEVGTCPECDRQTQFGELCDACRRAIEDEVERDSETYQAEGERQAAERLRAEDREWWMR